MKFTAPTFEVTCKISKIGEYCSQRVASIFKNYINIANENP